MGELYIQLSLLDNIARNHGIIDIHQWQLSAQEGRDTNSSFGWRHRQPNAKFYGRFETIIKNQMLVLIATFPISNTFIKRSIFEGPYEHIVIVEFLLVFMNDFYHVVMILKTNKLL